MNLLRCLVAGLLLAGAAAVQAQLGDVETVAPDQLEALLSGQKGRLVVSLSSRDAQCGPCVRHNAKFRIAAQGKRDFGRYVQVLWAPWTAIPPPVRTMLSAHGINGVPATLVFKDGGLEGKQPGEMPQPASAPPAPETGSVAQLLPQDAAGALSHSRGTVVVMLSSFETSCAFCLRANPGFEDLARTAPGVRFLRVMYRPWTWAAEDDFGKLVQAKGLPVYLAYRDGKLARRHDGLASVDELRTSLLAGSD
jgi:hypothetical protein